MPGASFKTALTSYVAFAKESTFGTYATATSAVEFLSCQFKTDIASQKLDSISMNRGFSKRVQLGKSVAGSMDCYLHPQESPLLLLAAMGGTITTTGASATGFIHSISAGNFDTAPSSLSFNVRKGNEHTWQYVGGRVNNLRISANVGEPVKCSYDMVFKDSTQTANDVSSVLSISSILPFTFVDGVYQYAQTEALADTTTAQEPIQSFELSVNNNLATGAEARQLGSNVLAVLPPTRRDVQLRIKQRFDTTTAYQRFLQGTAGSVILKFTSGQAITTGVFYYCQMRLPKVYFNNAEPMIGSASEVLSMDIALDVVVDNPNTTTGKDIGLTILNDVASY